MSNKKFPYKKSPLSPGITPTKVILIYFRKYWKAMGIVFLSVLFGEMFLTGVSYVVKTIIDTIYQVQTGKTDIQTLYILSASVAGMGFIGNLFYRISGWVGRSVFPFIRRDIRVDFFTYLHSHTHRYFSNHFGGSLTNKITTVGRACDDIVHTVSWDIFPSTVNILLSLTFLFIASKVIGFLTLGIIIIYLAIFFPFFKKARELSIITSDARSVSTGKVADVVTNIWNLQSHARGRYEESYLVTVFEDEVNKQLASWGYMEHIRLWQGITMTLFIGMIGTTTIWLWSLAEITIGNVALVFMISLGILQTVRNLAQRLLDFNEKKSDIQDAIDTIIVPYEIEINEAHSTELPIESGSVELKNITFAYDDRGNVFDKLSLTIPHGQKVGFVGVSGSGKSTLVLLLQRFYDIQSGSIFVGEKNISEISQDTLRRAIAVVPQDPVLFHRSLFDNIAYGSPDATHEDVLRAAHLAYADEFIDSLPEKYEAKVGERGVKLSGGQRQRIAIARAILKAAPILLLDEATSALDSESEELIQKALETIMKGKTVIAIAHRLSTLKNMDRIIVLEKGKIIEDGSHEELINKNGHYAYLYKKQVQGFMVEG